MSEPASKQEVSRRSLVVWGIRAVTLGITAMVGIPTAIHALSPALDEWERDELWSSLGPVDRFPVGEVALAMAPLPPRKDGTASFHEKGVFVWRSPEGPVVYSRDCTDLGCPIRWDPGSACFLCPCHGGIFSQSGQVLAGPPRRPLDRYGSRIREGVLEIDLASLPVRT